MFWHTKCLLAVPDSGSKQCSLLKSSLLLLSVPCPTKAEQNDFGWLSFKKVQLKIALLKHLSRGRNGVHFGIRTIIGFIL